MLRNATRGAAPVICWACLVATAIGSFEARLHAAEIQNDAAGVELTTSDVWFTLPDHLRAAFNASLAKGVKLHAEKLGVELKAGEVSEQIVVVQSKTLFGAEEDNPNIIVAVERAWSDQFEKTGKGYHKLMIDRVKRLGAPTQFSGEPRELRIGGQAFAAFDAENSNVTGATTKQRYIAGFNRGHYIVFILSYNSEDDEDFRAMMKVVESVKFRE